MKPVVLLAVLVTAGATVGFRASSMEPKLQEAPLAPELVGGPWLNTPNGKPISFESRRGKPTLVAFWTFACANCQNNLKPYARLYKEFKPQGVELLSVHTPELAIEHDPKQVAEHVKRFNIDYPVILDDKGENWTRWHQQYWPTLYVIDRTGHVVYHWEGELNYNGADGEAKVAKILRQLIAQRN